FRGRVPEAILQVFANTFDLGWPAIIHSHSPMRDVAVMPDPVHQLPAAVIEIPAPIRMHPGRTIRGPWRGAKPGFIIQPRRRRAKGLLSFRSGKIRCPFGQSHFDGMNFSDTPVENQLTCKSKITD